MTGYTVAMTTPYEEIIPLPTVSEPEGNSANGKGKTIQGKARRKEERGQSAMYPTGTHGRKVSFTLKGTCERGSPKLGGVYDCDLLPMKTRKEPTKEVDPRTRKSGYSRFRVHRRGSPGEEMILLLIKRGLWLVTGK